MCSVTRCLRSIFIRPSEIKQSQTDDLIGSRHSLGQVLNRGANTRDLTIVEDAKINIFFPLWSIGLERRSVNLIIDTVFGFNGSRFAPFFGHKTPRPSLFQIKRVSFFNWFVRGHHHLLSWRGGFCTSDSCDMRPILLHLSQESPYFFRLY